MEDYKVHTVLFYPFHSDIVSGMFWSLPIEGITEEDNSLLLYSKKSSGILKSDLEKILNSLVENNILENYEINEGVQEQKNWNEYWESRLNIIHATDRITIKPTSRDYKARDNEIVITIDPKMSFGTGEHETTRLCLQAIEGIIKPGDKVLDLGSGTGILAIASAKLGAKKVYAIDNDEWCLDNGKENVTMNSADNNVEVVLGDVNNVEENEFDAVIANINKNVLIGLGQQISQKISEAGKLIISGFYKTDVDDLTEYFEKYDLKKIRQNDLNNWCSVTFKKL